MRSLIIAATAATMAIPVSFALPTDQAEAQRRAYRDYNGPTWRGRDGRTCCRRSNGTTGLLVGGAAGALIGRELDGGRNRATGTILGAAAGALVGREVQRGRSSRHCR